MQTAFIILGIVLFMVALWPSLALTRIVMVTTTELYSRSLTSGLYG